MNSVHRRYHRFLASRLGRVLLGMALLRPPVLWVTVVLVMRFLASRLGGALLRVALLCPPMLWATVVLVMLHDELNERGAVGIVHRTSFSAMACLSFLSIGFCFFILSRSIRRNIVMHISFIGVLWAIGSVSLLASRYWHSRWPWL